MEKVTTKKCCVLNCDNGDSEDVCLFNFPTDFNLCMLWVQNTGQPEHFEDFAFGGALPFLTRYICSEHFSSVDFVDIKDKQRGLLPGAVPVLNYVELNEVKVKEEIVDVEYTEPAVDISKLGVDVKEEPYDDDSNAPNISCDFSDPLADSFTAESSKEEQQLSDEFFCNYRVAQERITDKAKRAWAKRVKRNEETDEQKKERNMKNALRAAIRRQNETPDQRERRRINDLLRARRRRSAETEQETRIRRYNDAVRAALRRQNETEEQRAERRMYDSKRAAFRRSQESPEQRAMRLKKDRERASRNRLLKKIFHQVHMLENMHEFIPIADPNAPPTDTDGNSEAEQHIPDPTEPSSDTPLNISTIGSAVKGCNENTNINRLQEVLQFLQHNTKIQGDIHPAQLRDAIVNSDSNPLKDHFNSYSEYLAKLASESSKSKTPKEPGGRKSNDSSVLETRMPFLDHSALDEESVDDPGKRHPMDNADPVKDVKRRRKKRTHENKIIPSDYYTGHLPKENDLCAEERNNLDSSAVAAVDYSIPKTSEPSVNNDNSKTFTEATQSSDKYVQMPSAIVEYHNNANNAAAPESNSATLKINKMIEGTNGYSVNFADIPKEIRDHCIPDSHLSDNLEQYKGFYEKRQQLDVEAEHHNTSAEQDQSEGDYVEMPPVMVELHEGSDDATGRTCAAGHNSDGFEVVKMIQDEAYYSVNLDDIPKAIRDHIGDSERSENWENGLVQQDTG